MNDTDEKRRELRRLALEYHEHPVPGKIAVTPTKQLVNQHDLALAYSPGVAAACEEIVADPANAFRYTARGNLVAVITNGTAVLGLGNIGPLAAKPVMEGKGVLFKKFAGIDSIVLEIEQRDPEKFVEAVAVLEPSFGAILRTMSCFSTPPADTPRKMSASGMISARVRSGVSCAKRSLSGSISSVRPL